MPIELKFRISDTDALRARIESLGGQRGERLHIRSTYFKQPPGEVLKISEDETGSYLIHLRAYRSGFELVSNERLDDVNAMRKELVERYGHKSTLIKEEIQYSLPGKSYTLAFR